MHLETVMEATRVKSPKCYTPFRENIFQFVEQQSVRQDDITDYSLGFKNKQHINNQLYMNEWVPV